MINQVVFLQKNCGVWDINRSQTRDRLSINKKITNNKKDILGTLELTIEERIFCKEETCFVLLLAVLYKCRGLSYTPGLELVL